MANSRSDSEKSPNTKTLIHPLPYSIVLIVVSYKAPAEECYLGHVSGNDTQNEAVHAQHRTCFSTFWRGCWGVWPVRNSNLELFDSALKESTQQKIGKSAGYIPDFDGFPLKGRAEE